MKKLGVMLMLAVVLSVIAQIAVAEDPLALLRGKGCWIQERSLFNDNITSEVFDWYVVAGGLMSDPLVIAKIPPGRPIFMATTFKEADNVMKRIDMNVGKIVGVIWDFEFPRTKLAVAEPKMKEVHEYAKSKGLLFGVAVVANPQKSRILNGIDYKRAEKFADFLLPMLYCQWWGCRESRTLAIYNDEVKRTTLPLVPIVALETTSDRVKEPILGKEAMASNYGTLSPAPLGYCFWSVANLDKEYLTVIEGLPVSPVPAP
jgi:hypothetical protein